MTDFVGRLAARSLGLPPRIEPLLESRFGRTLSVGGRVPDPWAEDWSEASAEHAQNGSRPGAAIEREAGAEPEGSPELAASDETRVEHFAPVAPTANASPPSGVEALSPIPSPPADPSVFETLRRSAAISARRPAAAPAPAPNAARRQLPSPPAEAQRDGAEGQTPGHVSSARSDTSPGQARRHVRTADASDAELSPGPAIATALSAPVASAGQTPSQVPSVRPGELAEPQLPSPSAIRSAPVAHPVTSEGQTQGPVQTEGQTQEHVEAGHAHRAAGPAHVSDPTTSEGLTLGHGPVPDPGTGPAPTPRHVSVPGTGTRPETTPAPRAAPVRGVVPARVVGTTTAEPSRTTRVATRRDDPVPSAASESVTTTDPTERAAEPGQPVAPHRRPTVRVLERPAPPEPPATAPTITRARGGDRPVEIRIGRVEVRTPPAAAPADATTTAPDPAPAPATTTPRLSLDEYLRLRDGR